MDPDKYHSRERFGFLGIIHIRKLPTIPKFVFLLTHAVQLMESWKSFQVPSLEPVVLTDLHLLAVLARAFGIIYPTSWTTQTTRKTEGTKHVQYLFYVICTEFSHAMGLPWAIIPKKHMVSIVSMPKHLLFLLSVPLYSNMVSSILQRGVFGSEVGPFPIGLRKEFSKVPVV